jgi:RNA polymerase sigma-70 factor (ECF subfamily)
MRDVSIRESGEVTRLLRQWTAGDPEARDELFPLVLDEVRTLARRALAGERNGHTLQPTALVNEVYLSLVNRRSVQWENRTQFFGALAEIMRRILVDSARSRLRDKRGGGTVPLALDDVPAWLEPTTCSDPWLLALDDALGELAELDAEMYRVVTLSHFMGLTQEQIADVTGVSVNTIGRRWMVAKKWLRHELSPAS